jgi:hypothetical protein
LDETKDFKSPEMKEKWRNFINKYEGGKVTDYNFGSLLRIDASKDYTQDNTMFGMCDGQYRRFLLLWLAHPVRLTLTEKNVSVESNTVAPLLFL